MADRNWVMEHMGNKTKDKHESDKHFDGAPRLLVPCSRRDCDRSVTEYRTFPRLVFPLFFNVFVSCFLSRGYGSRRSFPRPIPSRSPLLWLCRGVLQARRGNTVRWHHPQSSALARNARPVPPCLVFPSPLCPYMVFPVPSTFFDLISSQLCCIYFSTCSCSSFDFPVFSSLGFPRV